MNRVVPISPEMPPHIFDDPDFAHAAPTTYRFVPIEDIDSDARDEQYRREGVENSKFVLMVTLLGCVVFWALVIWGVARHFAGKH